MAENIELRIVALEVKMDTHQELLHEHKETLHEIRDSLSTIVSRLDKQNGALPHMAESLATLANDFASFKPPMLVEQATLKTKIRVIWTVIGSVGALILGWVAKVLLGN